MRVARGAFPVGCPVPFELRQGHKHIGRRRATTSPAYVSAADCECELLGEPYDDRAHEIAFFEIFLRAHRMGIVAGHTRVGDGQICGNTFELVAVFKRNYPGSW